MLLNIHYGAPGVYSSFASNNITLAYIDFGCASRFDPGSDRASWVGTGHWGTMEYAAPEIPRGDNHHHSQHSYSLPPADVGFEFKCSNATTELL
jgi:serine/threonine protein kinase